MSKEFEILLERYWNLAYLEGKSGVSQGDKANKVLYALRAMAEQPAPVQRPCRSCDGTGERFTGVDEAATTICKPCKGTGAVHTNPLQPAQPQRRGNA